MASRLSSLEMVKDRSSAYRIFVAAGEPRPVHFAAEELQAYLRRATGVVLPVTHQADGPAIRLRIRPPPQDRDGFRITAGERDLFIEGANGRSVLYGVYAFLEQGCGIGFYAPNFEHVPTLPALTIPADFHYEESADFKIRSIRTEWNTTPETVAWAAKHRFNAYSLDYWIWEQGSGGPLDIPGIFAVIEDRGLMAEGSGHAMWHFLKADDYLEQHPEWFAQVNGKPVCKKNTGDNFCYSNPAAVETFADNVIAFCRRFPQIRRISLWPGDGGAVCECAQCRSRPFMEWYGDVIARVTKRLHAVFPETTVIQFSYNGVAIKDDRLSLLDIPPRQPELPTLFSFWGQDLGQSLARNPDPAHRSVFRQIQAFCRRARGKCVMFSYHTDTFMNSNLCPVFDPAVMSEEFQDFKALDIDEVFLLWITWNTESDQNMSWLGYQNGALWGRRAMTARFDGAAFRRAYCRAVFGDRQAAAGGRLWNRLDDILRQQLPLVLPFAPRRPSDAWGCGFCRDVLKWEPTTVTGDLDNQRQKTFSRMAGELALLQDDLRELSEAGHPECGQFKKYVAHCGTRARGLALIFDAQAAMNAGDWPAAAALLQQSLDTGMTDERPQTEAWRQHARARIAGAVPAP